MTLGDGWPWVVSGLLLLTLGAGVLAGACAHLALTLRDLRRAGQKYETA